MGELYPYSSSLVVLYPYMHKIACTIQHYQILLSQTTLIVSS